MKSKLIKGLSQIQSKYDAFLIDLWGVIHNGIEVYPDAIDVLEALNKIKKRFVLISNAPRPSNNVKQFLLKMKMNEIFLQNIFTSGEAALKSLKKNTYGKNFYHLGPKRDNSLFEGFEENKKNLEDADFILCTGFLESNESSLNYYRDLLKNYIHIKMICTNPDLVVHRGITQEYCAGTLAEIFKELGGKVIYFGKPHPDIYNFCIKKKETILAIGDNIRTDIKGANNMNFDCLLITSGIHKKEFLSCSVEDYDKILKKYETTTNYYQTKLSW
ncbi:MAG: Ribonucleotide monophosphatase NagD, HAD superfamily [Pelagibacterales bacterium]|nr:Ribonucleotide monophosphatase NagD, HAD superfamily [Pelagibacterales bacterium]